MRPIVRRGSSGGSRRLPAGGARLDVPTLAAGGAILDLPTAFPGGVTQPPPPPPPPPPSGSVSDLVVTLDLGGGGAAVFDGATAVNMGDYIGEFVRQKCFVVVNANFPDWRVWMRPDANLLTGTRLAEGVDMGWRDEIVVEYGRTTHGTPANRITSYTFTVTKNGTTLASALTVPRHWWNARWRWSRSVGSSGFGDCGMGAGARPIVRTPADLLARKWLPPFGSAGLFGGTGESRPASVYQGPMNDITGDATSNRNMSSGGANPYIGFLPENAAKYVLGVGGSVATIRAEAEWMCNTTTIVRDDTTFSPINLQTSTVAASSYLDGEWSSGGVLHDSPTVADNDNTVGWLYRDPSHWYPLEVLAAMMFDDPYLIEQHQFGANWLAILNGGHRTTNSLHYIPYPGQTRAFGWCLRTLGYMLRMAQVTTPSWMLNRAYWQLCLNDCHTYAMKYVNSPARIATLFRVWTRTDWAPSWQINWLNASVGQLVYGGNTEWTDVLTWCMGYPIAMTNGTSGWNKKYPAPYYQHPLDPIAAPVSSQATLFWTDTSPDATTQTNWANQWTNYKTGESGNADLNGTTHSDATWSLDQLYEFDHPDDYLLFCRTALAMAATTGVSGAQACYDWLQSKLPAALSTIALAGLNGVGQARFSIDPVANNFAAQVAAAPSNSWVKATMANTLQSVWPGGNLQPGGANGPAGVIYEWGGLAWDDANTRIYAFGGGHAGYQGNEVYRWDGASRAWSRLCIPTPSSALDAFPHYEANDGYLNSPLSLHTYDANVFLPTLNKFACFGGATYGSGSDWTRHDAATVTGPYLFDPTRANAAQLGGATTADFSGATRVGGAMWSNRDTKAAAGLIFSAFASTAYVGASAGNDLVYAFNGGHLYQATMSPTGSGDAWVKVGNAFASFSASRGIAYAPSRNLVVAIGTDPGVPYWIYWSNPSSGSPPNSVAFTPTGPTPDLTLFGIDWDSARSIFVLWDGGPTVYTLTPPVSLPGTWTLTLVSPTGANKPAQSDGNRVAETFLGVYGKWNYSANLGAFIGCIDPFNGTVWAYKP